jgi:hypothetical protein
VSPQARPCSTPSNKSATAALKISGFSMFEMWPACVLDRSTTSLRARIAREAIAVGKRMSPPIEIALMSPVKQRGVRILLPSGEIGRRWPG